MQRHLKCVFFMVAEYLLGRGGSAWLAEDGGRVDDAIDMLLVPYPQVQAATEARELRRADRGLSATFFVGDIKAGTSLHVAGQCFRR